MDYTKKVEAIFDKYSERYFVKHQKIDAFKEGFDYIIGHFNSSPLSLLDIACGPGHISKYFYSKNKSINITGIDLSANMLGIASKILPEGLFLKMDCKNISSLKSTFDCIVLSFVCPYLNLDEVIKLISDCHSMLNKNGLLYLSTMEDDHSNSKIEFSSTKEDSMHISYYSKSEIRKILDDNNFNTSYESFVDSYPEKLSPKGDIIFIAQK